MVRAVEQLKGRPGSPDAEVGPVLSFLDGCLENSIYYCPNGGLEGIPERVEKEKILACACTHAKVPPLRRKLHPQEN